MIETPSIVACYDCDRLQQIRNMPEDGAIKCCRCGAVLRKFQRIVPERSIEYTLALTISAAVLYIIANVFPVLDLQIQGRITGATLFTGVNHFLEQDMKLL